MLVYCAVREGERKEAVDRSTPPAADIWVVELKTGLRMKLTDSAEADFNPVWADDGRIFFVSARAGSENIWSLSMSLEDYASRDADGTRVSRREPAVTTGMTED
jgi:Tol biopolymer transport system component